MAKVKMKMEKFASESELTFAKNAASVESGAGEKIIGARVNRDADGKLVDVEIGLNPNLGPDKIKAICDKINASSGVAKCAGYPMGGTAEDFESIAADELVQELQLGTADLPLTATVFDESGGGEWQGSADGEGKDSNRAIRSTDTDPNNGQLGGAVLVDAAQNNLTEILSAEISCDIKLKSADAITAFHAELAVLVVGEVTMTVTSGASGNATLDSELEIEFQDGNTNHTETVIIPVTWKDNYVSLSLKVLSSGIMEWSCAGTSGTYDNGGFVTPSDFMAIGCQVVESGESKPFNQREFHIDNLDMKILD